MLMTATAHDHTERKSKHSALTTSILVVDDDWASTDLLRIILEPKDFKVITANSGREGVEMARSLAPDVMVVDLFMPDMDGLSVCRQVRRFSNVPILMLTAQGRPDMLTKVLNEGADDYLVKPLNNNLLIASINRLARRAQGGTIRYSPIPNDSQKST
jgi:DNA-binding response OmpR family regulator